MEGLIPMVCRAIKRNKTRRNYRCLSKGNAQTYHIADFYHEDEEDRDRVGKFYSPQVETGVGFDARREFGRRRSMSTGGYNLNGGYDFNYHDYNEGNNVNGSNDFNGFPAHPPPNMELKRFRSHRMFSCVTGAT